ncbi:hypothetical protein ACMBCM_08145, partial [Spiroplasma sp. K1]
MYAFKLVLEKIISIFLDNFSYIYIYIYFTFTWTSVDILNIFVKLNYQFIRKHRYFNPCCAG